MKFGFIRQQIRRCNRNFFIVHTIVSFFIIVIILVPQLKDNLNIIAGPFKISNSEIELMDNTHDPHFYKLKAENPILNYQISGSPLNYNCYNYKGKYYFSVYPDDIINTNLIDKVYKKKLLTNIYTDLDFIKTTFYLLKINNKYLAVQVPDGYKGKSFTGVFVPLNSNDNTWISNVTHEMYPSTEGNILPFMFDTVLDLKFSYLAFAFNLILLALIVINYVRVIFRMLSFFNHPIYKRIKKYGLDIKVIDNEVEKLSERAKSENPVIISEFILKKTLFRLLISRKGNNKSRQNGKYLDVAGIFSNHNSH